MSDLHTTGLASNGTVAGVGGECPLGEGEAGPTLPTESVSEQPVSEAAVSPIDEITRYLQMTLHTAREGGDPEEVARVQRLVAEHQRLCRGSAGGSE